MAQRFTVGTNYLSASANIPDANSDYTTMAWVRIVSSPSGTQAVVWRHKNFTFGPSNHDDIIFADFGSGLILLATFSTSGTTATLVVSSLSDNNWYHIATVRDGTAVRVYKDGTLADDDTNDNSGRTDPTDFDVCKSDDGGQANEVDVEGLKFFARVLTAEQIAVEMKRTMPIGPNATNAWPFIATSNGRDYYGSCPLTLTGTLGASEPVGVQFRAASTDVMVWPPTGLAPITGTLTAEIAITLTADADLLIQGSLTADAGIAISADGDLLIQGSHSAEIGMGLGSDGDLLIQGSLSATIAITLTAEGEGGLAEITGDLSATLEVTLTSDGDLLIQGSLSATLELGLVANGTHESEFLPSRRRRGTPEPQRILDRESARAAVASQVLQRRRRRSLSPLGSQADPPVLESVDKSKVVLQSDFVSISSEGTPVGDEIITIRDADGRMRFYLPAP